MRLVEHRLRRQIGKPNHSFSCLLSNPGGCTVHVATGIPRFSSLKNIEKTLKNVHFWQKHLVQEKLRIAYNFLLSFEKALTNCGSSHNFFTEVLFCSVLLFSGVEVYLWFAVTYKTLGFTSNHFQRNNKSSDFKSAFSELWRLCISTHSLCPGFIHSLT